MADADRADAKSRRAEARRRRREAEQEPGGNEQPATDDETADSEHGGLKHAAKVAATGAAVGAAVAAALASRGDGSDGDDGNPQDEPAAQDEQSPEESQGQEPTDAGVAPAEEDSRSQPSAREPEPEEPVRGAAPGETADVVRIAREQLQALQGREPESVSSLARTAEGWAVTLEVVELPRVPDSTDVLASYELVLDEDKNVIRYARGRRYYRSQADSDGGL